MGQVLEYPPLSCHFEEQRGALLSQKNSPILSFQNSTIKDSFAQHLEASLQTNTSLDSPTIRFLENKKNLKNPVDIRSTISALQLILTRLNLQNTKQMELQQNIEHIIAELVTLQNNQDLETRQILLNTIKTLQNLQTSSNLPTFMTTQHEDTDPQNIILQSTSQFSDAASMTSIKPKERVDIPIRFDKSYILKQKDEIATLPSYFSHKNLRNDISSSSPVLFSDPGSFLKPKRNSECGPCTHTTPQISPNLNVELKSKSNLRLTPDYIPNSKSNLSLDSYSKSNINFPPTSPPNFAFRPSFIYSSTVSQQTPVIPKPLYSNVSKINSPGNSFPSITLSYPALSTESLPSRTASRLQYLDLEASLLSPLNTQVSSQQTDAILNLLTLNRYKPSLTGQQQQQQQQHQQYYMTSQPNLNGS